MREINFRAWDGERLREVNSIGWVDGELDWIDTPKYHGPIDKYIKLMQYTGLKDKYGVDIYEGDIVDYFKGEFAVIEKRVRGYVISSKNYEDDFWHISGKMKVIGNIYENPELL